MLETVIAVVIVTSLFLVLFNLSQLLTRKILVEHAAMRVARARAVGLNDFMCLKAARIAVIPVAGRRIWPTGDDEIGESEERARLPIYMQAVSEPIARGVLEYEGWSRLSVKPGDGTDSRVNLSDLTGTAGIEWNSPFYLSDSGL